MEATAKLGESSLALTTSPASGSPPRSRRSGSARLKSRPFGRGVGCSGTRFRQVASWSNSAGRARSCSLKPLARRGACSVVYPPPPCASGLLDQFIHGQVFVRPFDRRRGGEEVTS